MKFQSLEYLVQIARDKNITRSAEKLHTTQQCLSGHIKRMEEYYGVKLFERKPQLKLTEEGRAVLEFAERALELEKQLFDDLYMVSSRQKGRIALGMTPSRSEFLAPDLMAEYARTHPHVIVELNETSAPDVDQLLVDGVLDCYLGIHDGPSPNLMSHKLRKEPIYLIISDALLETLSPELRASWDRQMEEKGGLTLRGMEEVPFLLHAEGKRMHIIESACLVEAGLTPNVRMVSKLSPTLLKMCYQGQGVCLVNSLNFAGVPADCPIHYYPVLLDGRRVCHEIYLIYRKQMEYAPYFEDFVHLVCDMVG